MYHFIYKSVELCTYPEIAVYACNRLVVFEHCETRHLHTKVQLRAGGQTQIRVE